MFVICVINCYRSIHKNSCSCSSFYPSIFIYDFSRVAAWFKIGSFSCDVIYSCRSCRDSCFCCGRRNKLYFAAKFRIFNRLCTRSFCNGKNRGKFQKSFIKNFNRSEFCRLADGLLARDDLLRINQQFLFRKPHRFVAIIFILFYFSSSGRYCSVFVERVYRKIFNSCLKGDVKTELF